jgi:hypothetical protein
MLRVAASCGLAAVGGLFVGHIYSEKLTFMNLDYRVEIRNMPQLAATTDECRKIISLPHQIRLT